MDKKMEWGRRALKNRKVRWVIGALLVVAMIAAVTNTIIQRRLDRNVNIADVFQKSKVVTNQSALEMAAQYETKVLSNEQKEQVLHSIADEIGLQIENDDFIWEKNNKSEQVSVQKKSRAANTKISLISVNVNDEGEIPVIQNYIMVHLDVFDQVASILDYKEMIHKGFKDLKMMDESSYLQFTGKYPGMLTLDSKNQIADNMIRGLRGHIAYENRADDLYTVYAYSGGLTDYISVGESKVNIQVAMSYDEKKNETVVYLATPILNGSY